MALSDAEAAPAIQQRDVGDMVLRPIRSAPSRAGIAARRIIVIGTIAGSLIPTMSTSRAGDLPSHLPASCTITTDDAGQLRTKLACRDPVGLNCLSRSEGRH